jgi:hypothetical protein
VETDFRGGQGSPRAVVPRALETGCRGGQGSPRAQVPSGRKEGRREERRAGGKEVGRFSKSLHALNEIVDLHQQCNSPSTNHL